jgi:hypothetical protein
MKVLLIDVGATHVQILATDQRAPLEFFIPFDSCHDVIKLRAISNSLYRHPMFRRRHLCYRMNASEGENKWQQVQLTEPA